MSTYSYIDEDLKGRMLRHIAALWGVKNTEALDPLVRLMIEALAGELQKTYHDIHSFEKKILEKIAVLMTPGLMSAPYGAHGIAHAQPVDSKLTIYQTTHFFYRKKMGKDTHAELFFTPVDNVSLFDGDIKYIVTGNKVFTTDENMQKSLVIDGRGSYGQNNTIWLGIKFNQDVKSMNRLRFYFDFRNTQNKQPLLSLLQISQWEINGKKLDITKGILYEAEETQSAVNALFSDYDPMFLLEKEVKHMYQEQFVTLLDKEDQLSTNKLKRLYPFEFESSFSPNDLNKLADELVWVKITTPSPIEEKMLFDLFACINAFPIINRKYKNAVHRFKGVTNIIPVKAELFEYFLSVKTLKDSKDREYKQIPFSYQEMSEIGTYSIRKSGTERIDSRTAKEYLNYLVELIRDESVAFSSFGQDAVGGLLKEMDKLLAQVEQRIKQSKDSQTDSDHYITIEFKDKEESIFLEYWITNSDLANKINTGARLNLYQGSEIKRDSVSMLTTTMGGKKPLDSSRHMDAYKYSMLTHNRLITIEDIKAFCLYELGDKISEVEIRKAITKSDNPKEGLVRCIEVILKKRQEIGKNVTAEEWNYVLKETKIKMEMRSAVNLNYKLLLV